MSSSSDPARRALLASLALLAACGDLPQPFRGRPGGLAGDLSQPPGLRVAVARPGVGALLDSAAAERFAEALATSLRGNEVPATAADPLPLDWRVTVEASQDGRSVTPRFTLLNPDGVDQGRVTGRAVAFRAWADANEDALRGAAQYAAPRLAELLLRAEARRRGTTPDALAGNAPRVFLAGVRGAPGDGNTALAERVRGALNQRGMVVQDNAVAAGFAVSADVSVVASGMPNEQRVEIVWTVSRRDGEDLGRVIQLNTIPARSLDRFWGDVASAAASEAAGGIRDVIRNAGGFPEPPAGAARPDGLAIPASSAPPPPAPATPPRPS